MRTMVPGLALTLTMAWVATGCAPVRPGPAVDLPADIPVDRAPDLDPELADTVESIVLEAMVAQRFPGLAVALVDDGRVVYAGGFGWADIEAQRPLGADTPVLLSSVSKTFVGVAAMQAVAEGRVDLSDPLADHLGYPVDNPKVDGETLTLRHLLTHHSGIEDSLGYGLAYAEGDPEIALADWCEGYLTPNGTHWRGGNFAARQPGEAFSYSNVGMACVAGAIADADPSVDTFDGLVQRDIIRRLGLENTAYYLEDLETAPATPYRRVGDGSRVKPYPQYGYPTYPDGMIRSSARDLGLYVAAVAGQAEAGSTQALMPEALRVEMLTVDPSLGTDEEGQAIAWAMRELDGQPLIGHNGGDYGSLAELWLDPETGDGFALAANGFPESWQGALQLESDLMQLVRDAPEGSR